MNLQDFLKRALVEIVNGVADASEAAHESGASLGSFKFYGRTDLVGRITDSRGRPVAHVEFDIVLADGTATDTKGGIGVYLGAVGLGSQGASHGESSTHSRVKFSVPIIFPPAKGTDSDGTFS